MEEFRAELYSVGDPKGLIMNSPRLQPGVGISRGQPVQLLMLIEEKEFHGPAGTAALISTCNLRLPKAFPRKNTTYVILSRFAVSAFFILNFFYNNRTPPGFLYKSKIVWV